MAYKSPLQAHVVDDAVFVCAPDGGADLWMTPEAVLESLEILKQAAEDALRRRRPDAYDPADEPRRAMASNGVR